MSLKTGFKQIALPVELVDGIKEFIDNNKDLGYMSVPEFVRESIRFYLREINQK